MLVGPVCQWVAPAAAPPLGSGVGLSLLSQGGGWTEIESAPGSDIVDSLSCGPTPLGHDEESLPLFYYI
jgi:hypothetical protein